MTRHFWTPASNPTNARDFDFRLSADDFSGTPPGWSVTKRTLREGLSRGVELVEIDNSRLKLVIVPTRGMGLWYASLNGTRLGWESPVRGPIHPQFVPINEASGIGWLDGFDELMVRCGLESSGGAVFGPTGQLVYPLHGRIANRPAHSLSVAIDDTSGTIEVSALVDEIRFHFQKLQLKTTFITQFGSTSFSWNDRVENLGGNVAKMQMLYHVNIGHPLLAPGSQLLAPVRVVSPHDQTAALAGTKNYHTYPPQKVGARSPILFLRSARRRSWRYARLAHASERQQRRRASLQ